MIDYKEKYKAAFDFLGEELNFSADYAIVLGSGLGNFANSIECIKKIPCNEIPDYPQSTVKGHAGNIIYGRHSNKNLLMFQGRVHLYEGYSFFECLLPIFIAKHFESKKIILTNAAGGITFGPGSLMMNTSMNSFNIKNELAKFLGILDENSIQLLRTYPLKDFADAILKAADNLKLDVKSGQYWYTKGPNYETASEVQMAKIFGADAVGMSTVHELVFSLYLKMETIAISCITNFAAGMSDAKLDHSDVTATAKLVENNFQSLIKEIITIY